MKIAVLGTGGVGKAFAKRLTELGHQVCLGTRDVNATLEKTGASSVSEFMSNNPLVKLNTFAGAASFGELIINASKGEHTPEVITAAGIDNLSGKIIIDISNPLDFSNGMPPSLIPKWSNTNSLGEEIQKMIPGAKVVKTLNTMWNGLMLNPTQLAGGDHINYICGNDAGAKEQVINLLKEFGWKAENVLDLGDITAARATEATLPIWLRIYGAKKSGAFNFKIIG
ncbi:MAG: NAD(P)-binding domain-containing protein [Bacteroidia bacterium]|nr:NAD(P)-binding domain-containing protein [Bacteroidia bacterium]